MIRIKWTCKCHHQEFTAVFTGDEIEEAKELYNNLQTNDFVDTYSTHYIEGPDNTP